MSLTFAKKPNDWDTDVDLDIESSNMAVLGGMTDDDKKKDEEEDEDEDPEKEKVVKDVVVADEDEPLNELVELERLAEAERNDRPNLDDLGMEEEA